MTVSLVVALVIWLPHNLTTMLSVPTVNLNTLCASGGSILVNSDGGLVILVCVFLIFMALETHGSVCRFMLAS